MRFSFLYHERFRRYLGQGIFLCLVLGVVYSLIHNMSSALAERGLYPSFDFITLTSGFDIGEHLFEYSRSSSYVAAFAVGICNTVMIGLVSIILSSILGLIIGLSRLSSNFLIRSLSSTYVNIARNVPLLLLLIFWKTGLFHHLPRVQEAFILPGPTFISNRGIALPWFEAHETLPTFLYCVLAALLIGHIVKKLCKSTLWGMIVLAVIIILSFTYLKPFLWDQPYLKGFNTKGGLSLSPELLAVVSGLVIYHAAFIAEAVRAGMQAIPKGQEEAAKALGLNSMKVTLLVILPQALRIIIPPVISIYLNVIKNSSLASYIGYPDLFAIAGTIFNQTGRAVEVISLLMITYLSFSLITSIILNCYNKRVAIKER